MQRLRASAQLNAELDARIAELNHDMDTELYPHMLTAVAGRRKVIYMAINNGIQEGLEACIEHGRAGRSLAAVEAYDSGVEAKYVAAVHNLENVSFPLLDQLEALKDSPLELLMSSLTLEGSYIEDDPTPKFRKSISHEILLSDALAALRARCEKHKKARLEIGGPSVVTPSLSSQEESLAVADHQVSSAANVDGTV
ncbi:hypothetical protein Tco_0773122 [Tanacetum coccineum]|uniref:Uncharacterized protein n=1 Tax=Tanacetum coccineum TaxID=301880 RepID=A0ABQ4ZL48_9ASTR